MTLQGTSRYRVAAVALLLLGVLLFCGGCGVRSEEAEGGEASGARPTHRADTAHMPPALRASSVAARQRNGGEAYRFERAATGGAAGRNDAHGLDLALAEGALGATRTGGDGWHVGLRWTGLGRGSSLAPVVQPESDADVTGNRASYRRADGSEERYVSGLRGVEQGFVLPTAPVGAGGEALTIEVTASGDLAPALVDGGAGVALRDARGRAAARYTDLAAFDADGVELRSWLEVSGCAVRLRVDDEDARYPLWIDPLIWTQEAQLMAGDEAAGAFFGSSVGLSGGVAIVGAQSSFVGGGLDAAYVFARTGTGWTQQAELTTDDAALGLGDAFGASVAVDGGTAIVGAPMHAVGGNLQQGAAYVFVQSGTTWQQQAVLTASDGGPGAQFGASVSLSGGVALVGAPGPHLGASGGAAYVFVQDGAVWTQQAELVPSDPAPGDGFGGSVSWSGGTALVGADFGGGYGQGGAYVFVQMGTLWIEEAELTASDGFQGDQFGSSVSLSGGTALVTAPSKSVGPGFSAGAAYVFVQSGENWFQKAELTRTSATMDGQFGSSVSVSGGTALVGAELGDNGAPGAAYVFVQVGTVWTQAAELTARGGSGDDYFGSSVSLSGGVAIAGAPGDAPAVGAAYVFEFCVIGGVAYPSGPSPANTCQSCEPATSPTAWTVQGDGAACNAGCTMGGTCQGGVCMGANEPLACAPEDQCHAAGICDPATFTCSNPAQPEDTVCDDGDACTRTDTCEGGLCIGSNPVVCTAEDKCHLVGTCDLTTGVCSNPPVACTAQDQCHVVGVCDPTTGACSNPGKPDGAACDDGDACTLTDTCQGGVCVGGDPVVCQAMDECHVPGTCDPSSGTCSIPAQQPDGAACANGTCETGVCVPNTDGQSCSSGAQCATGFCVDGACCDSPSCAPCYTCSPPFAPGHCEPELAGSDAQHVCANLGCDGACDGHGACAFVAPNTPCAPAQCSDETHSAAPVLCLVVATTCAAQPAVSTRDCAPFRCDPGSGECVKTCASLEDCAPGSSCNLDGRCVAPPGVESGGGCSVAAPASVRGALPLLAAIALAGWARRSSRRARRRPAPRTAGTRTAMLLLAALLFCGGCGVGAGETRGGEARSEGAAPREVSTWAMPPALRASYLAARQRGGGEAYRFERDPSGGAVGTNEAHRLEVALTNGALGVTRAGGGWHMGLRWTGIGRGSTLAPAATPRREADLAGHRASYRRADGSEERYVNGPLGVEQTFVLPSAPAGPRGDALVVGLSVEGDLSPALTEDGAGVALRDARGAAAARYTDLVAFDADGIERRSWVEVSGGVIRLRVDDAGARYPLWIDPMLWTLETELTPSDAVSVSGDTAIVGAPGAAYVFVQSSGTWTQEATLAPSHGGTDSSFGASVSVSGDTAIVGASGAAYVFMRSGGTWTQEAILSPADGDLFGASVSVSGDTAIVGAPGCGGACYKPGAAYVFVQSGGTWTQEARLTPSDGWTGDFFGASVSVSAGIAVVGAIFHPAPHNVCGPGAAYVFARSGTTWTQEAELSASDGAPGDAFGNSVSMSGGAAVVVGAPAGGSTYLPSFNCPPSPAPGAAYVFVQGHGTWTEQAELTPSDGTPSDAFAASVSMSGGTAIIGASNHAGIGAAYLFVQDGAIWTEQAELTPSEGGACSSVSVDGDRAIIGTLGAAYALDFCVVGGAAYQCPAGTSCVNGVCCDSPCACGVCDVTGHCGPAANDSKVGVVCAPFGCAADGTHGVLESICTAEGTACPEGELVDCFAYRCDEGTKRCRTSCDAPDECAPGFSCDVQGHCVAPPPPQPGPGACSLPVGAPRRSGAPWLAAVLFAALARSARRRHRRTA